MLRLKYHRTLSGLVDALAGLRASTPELNSAASPFVGLLVNARLAPGNAQLAGPVLYQMLNEARAPGTRPIRVFGGLVDGLQVVTGPEAEQVGAVALIGGQGAPFYSRLEGITAKQVGKWASNQQPDLSLGGIFPGPGQPGNGPPVPGLAALRADTPTQRVDLPTDLASSLTGPGGSIFLLGDRHLEHFLRAMQGPEAVSPPGWSVSGAVAAATPFVTGLPWSMFMDEQVLGEGGVVGVALPADGAVAAESPATIRPLRPISAVYRIARCSGNILVDLAVEDAIDGSVADDPDAWDTVTPAEALLEGLKQHLPPTDPFFASAPMSFAGQSGIDRRHLPAASSVAEAATGQAPGSVRGERHIFAAVEVAATSKAPGNGSALDLTRCRVYSVTGGDPSRGQVGLDTIDRLHADARVQFFTYSSGLAGAEPGNEAAADAFAMSDAVASLQLDMPASMALAGIESSEADVMESGDLTAHAPSRTTFTGAPGQPVVVVESTGGVVARPAVGRPEAGAFVLKGMACVVKPALGPACVEEMSEMKA
ncbi:hypothetical protein H696_04871 [Fonticula alba]|uniref:FIST domain-containing protein n=1 Tax=Fonticula alba TaxID=691883 RepID=A0A058Z4Y9_FONAL|nr:hypothetical protein H696_04871 [Fonticula alba]KCV68577.1 hypothetical protein H696_04871 [Fonticula alba]|eukprot:XP_009497009.1 hypothetical protein H696_04871 [Fonticula alba]